MQRCTDCGRARASVKAPGPRCATCRRLFAHAQRDRAWERRIEQTYGITGDEYQAILKAQGGKCFICQRATGKTRRLSVDHDHTITDKRRSVRGILCRPCNNLLGHLRGDTAAFERGIFYLTSPPAQFVLNPRSNDE